ncbi:MAG TPA: glycosyltransferase family 39 protein [Tepidisphaeraceae bacterium]|nr:glycosyltransferase family 39 protein [Tepidisphaeraceae bacterium]
MSTSTYPSNGDKQPTNGDTTANYDAGVSLRERSALAPESVELDISVEKRPALIERRLVVPSPLESAGRRWLFLVLAFALAAAQHAFSHTYWSSGHYGNNQNAYLVAGKLLATTGTTGFEPKSPWEFVGWMWNMAEEGSTAAGGGWVYPKYPAGLPLLNAVAFKVGYAFGGMDAAVFWTYKVSPICTTAAALGVFFILRLIANSFAGVMGMISFSTLSVVLVLMNNPYSHASDMAFVTWGIYALLKWWQHGRWWRGSLAGLLLGYAATIRYTEGLLVLPIIAVVICSMRWTSLRSWLRVSVPLLAWAMPLTVLVIFNWFTVGSITGYDSTNESTGFTLKEMARKWRWGIDQLYNTGLYIIFPLTIGGLVMGFKWNWRVALVLVLWFVPSTLLYFSYYWGMNLPVWGFMRFFASVLPAGVIAAVWMMHHAVGSALDHSEDSPPIVPLTRRRALLTGATIAGSGVVAFAVASLFLKPDWQFDDRTELLVVGITLLATTIAAGVSVAGRGGAIMGAIGMATLVAFPAAIHLDVSDSPLERDLTIATNLNYAGQRIRESCPDGSLVFVNAQRVGNFLQFAGNYELYGSDYIVGGRPVPQIRGGPDSENPNPIQPARAKFVAEVYRKFEGKARVAAAADICVEAIQSNRRVFIVKEVDSAGALINELTRTGRLRGEDVAQWIDPARMSSRAMNSLTNAGADGIARRDPWRWKIVEMKLADAPAPAPASAPTPTPSTLPGE